MVILIAASGGVDSMYLAWRRRELFPGADFAIAHCNFQLRGEESDGDEAFVRDWCRDNGVHVFVRKFETEAYATEKGVSIEMAARDLRYAWFSELCSGSAKELEGSGFRGFDALAVAHNANDNAETLMLNLLRGTGTKGMCGMKSSSIQGGYHTPDGSGIRILRPLLETERRQIEAWMVSEGHPWREDRTNAENDAKRNRIRNQVFPIFAEMNPSFVRTLGRDMAHISLVDEIAEEYFLNASGTVLKDGAINLKALLGLRHWKYVLWRLIEQYNLSEETFGKLTELLESDRTISGKTFESPTHILSIRKKTLVAAPREKNR